MFRLGSYSARCVPLNLYRFSILKPSCIVWLKCTSFLSIPTRSAQVLCWDLSSTRILVRFITARLLISCYERYWNDELFIKQVYSSLPTKEFWLKIITQLKEWLIPAFKKSHGPGYQALFIVDNLQGHSAYLEDALLISRMNVGPGGKQAWMHDG